MAENTVTNVEIYSDTISELGESPLYYDGVFYWVDIARGTLTARYSNSQERVLYRNLENAPTSVVPGKDGKLYLTLANGFYSIEKSGILQLQSGFTVTDPMVRFNDGKCDPAGNYWAGTMDKSEINPKGALYVLNPEKRLTQILTGVTVSNGLCWNSDQSILYYVDSPTKRIRAFDLDMNTMTLSNRRSIFRIEDRGVFPDGMCLDSEGNIWLALWGGYSVVCVDPQRGEIRDKVNVPCSRVTSCCFGGDHFDELLITTATGGMNEKEIQKFPDSGKVFRAYIGVTGMKPDTFG